MKTKLLLLLVLANFSIYAQTNLVPNGDFENWSSSSQPDSWYRYFSGFVSQSTIAQNGASSTNMMIASGTLNYINSEYFPVTANKTYRITMYHKLVKGTFSSLDFSIYHKPGTFKEEIIKKTETVFSASEWKKIEFEYTSTVSENIEVDVFTTGTLDSEILVDNISVVDVEEIPVPVEYTKIPDIEFEKKLISLGIDSGEPDGQVPTNNINKLTSLNVSSSKITDATGIQDFVSLTSLNMYGNRLKSLDLSKNTALKEVNCGWNYDIASLNISNNPALTNLYCYYNKLSSLDISNNTNLKILDCTVNLLESLNVSNNTNLDILICSVNKLTTLDISKNTALTRVEFSNNLISSFDASNNINLSKLNCYDNKIEALDVSKNTSLQTLSCGANLFTALDLSKNTALTTVECNYSKTLEQINLKNGQNTVLKTGSVKVNNSPNLTCVLVDDEAYSIANWSENNPDGIFTETTCPERKYTLIPDLNFEKSLIKKGLDGVEDGKVLTSKISTVKILDLSDYYTNLEIKDLSGIQDFVELEELTLPNNNSGKISSLDISKNQKLKKLNCSYNDLTSLDISKNLALEDLNCSLNYLESLDVSKNTALKKLDVSYNRLTNLDVTTNTNLTSLGCAGSHKAGSYVLEQGLLTSIDLSKNTALENLDIGYNEKITNLDLTKNTKLLYLSVNGNKRTDVNFTENKLLKTLSCESNKLTSIDLSLYPDLERLGCSYNEITTLDVSKSEKLVFLSAMNNKLTHIDVSKNVLLQYLYCSSNKLTSLDVSQNKNLIQLLCSDNADLLKLNIKNGNNINFSSTYTSSFRNNPNLSCITVDDVDYANKKWAAYIDATASFNTECFFSVPADNFSIETKGESCVDEKNGEITITAVRALPYSVDISGKTYEFTNPSLNVKNVAPGTYNIKISIPSEGYEQSFTATIAKAATTAGKSTLTSKTVNVEITAGTAPFTVFVDGAEQFQTTDSNFSLDLENSALVEVATAKACEGIYSKKVALSGASETLLAYPNPTTGSVEIEIPETKSEIAVEVYNFGGQLVSKNTYAVENGKVKLNLENQPSGIYAAKVYLKTPEYLKIIKK